LVDSATVDLNLLYNQSMLAPMAIRQKEIPTAGTAGKSLAIMGDVLTENIASTKSRTILYLEINCILKLSFGNLLFDSFVSHDADMGFQYFLL
jgi:hypothetical protein